MITMCKVSSDTKARPMNTAYEEGISLPFAGKLFAICSGKTLDRRRVCQRQRDGIMQYIIGRRLVKYGCSWITVYTSRYLRVTPDPKDTGCYSGSTECDVMAVCNRTLLSINYVRQSSVP